MVREVLHKDVKLQLRPEGEEVIILEKLAQTEQCVEGTKYKTYLLDKSIKIYKGIS